MQHYSDSLWVCIRMSEAGIVLDPQRLLSIETRLKRWALIARDRCKRKFNLVLEGDGSKASKDAFLDLLCQTIDTHASPTSSTPSPSVPSSPLVATSSAPLVLPSSGGVRSHPRLKFTDKKMELSFCTENRNLLASLLPPQHPLQEALKLVDRYTWAQKIMGTYTWPLLRHNRKKPSDKTSILVPRSIPSWNSTTPSPPNGPTSSTSACPRPASSSVSPTEKTSTIQAAPSTDLQVTSSFPPLSKAKTRNLLRRLSTGSALPPSLRGYLQSSTRTSSRPSRLSSAARRRWWTSDVRLLFRSSSRTCTSSDAAKPTGSSSPSPLTPTSILSRGIPAPCWIAVPNWYLVPSHPKDGAGSEGGTKQGRITAKGAAQPQTWPPVIKGCIISHWQPYGVLLWSDASQIELRVAALCSGDEGMLRVYQLNGDIHDDMAVRIFGPSVLEDPNYRCGDGKLDKRQWAKTINFLVLYRGGWEKLQATLLGDCGVLLPDKVCQEIAWSMPDKRPGLWAWQEALVALARSRGYVEVPFTGQSRWFMNQGRKNEDWDENEIVNMPVQTIAGTVLLQIQAELHRRLPHLNTLDPDILMCHQVYDSILLDCRSMVAAERARQLLQEAVHTVATTGYWHLLEQHYGRRVPLIMESKIVTRKAA